VLALNQDVRNNKAHSIGTCPITDPMHAISYNLSMLQVPWWLALMRQMASEMCAPTKHKRQSPWMATCTCQGCWLDCWTGV
jgi:hypothetical protein